MRMSSEEVKEFWRGYCERRKLGKGVIAKGEAIIDENPEYWADETMDKLVEAIAKRSASM